MSERTELPNANVTLALGIASIVTCSCYGIIGLALGIAALLMSAQSVRLYRENPDMYDGWSNIHAGRICAIVGIVLNSLMILFIILYIGGILLLILGASKH